MGCTKHVKYQGIRKPRTGCIDCWHTYNKNKGLMTVEIKSEDGWEVSEFKDVGPGKMFRLIDPNTKEIFVGDEGNTEFQAVSEVYTNDDGLLTVDVAVLCIKEV